MVKSQGLNYNLKPTQFQRIGISEKGNRFRAFPREKQEQIVRDVLSNQTFINDMIKLSGFEQVEKLLKNCLKFYDYSMANSNIIQELENIKPIDINNLAKTLIPILKIYGKIKKINLSDYDDKMKALVKNINTQIYQEINKLNCSQEIILFYDRINGISSMHSIQFEIDNSCFNFESITIQQLLMPYYDLSKYPNYLIKKIIELISEKFGSNNLTIGELEYFYQLEKIGILESDVVELMLGKILTRTKKNIIIDSTQISNEKIIGIFEKINFAPNFIRFIRFFIRSKIICSKREESIIRLMMYKHIGEIPMHQYLTIFLAQQPNILIEHGDIFDIGFNPAIIYSNEFSIDKYYIEFAKINSPEDFINFAKIETK